MSRNVSLFAIVIFVKSLLDAADTGDYAIDDGKWIQVPLLKRYVTFGVQPVVTGP